MAKKKACKTCKFFYEGGTCPICGGKDTATTWKGRLFIIDFEKSEVGKKISVKKSGEYAIKVR